MSHSAGSTISAVLLEEAKAACWGTFQRVCTRALERLGWQPDSASTSDMRLDSVLGCTHVAQSHSWELLLCLRLIFSPSEL